MDQEVLKGIVAKVAEKMAAHCITKLHPKPFGIGVSNRHVHLSQGDLEILFGRGYTLESQRDLSQPEQYAAVETVLLAGPKGSIERVRVLGPVRNQTQVEISRGDTYRLGVKAPVRESGDLKGSGQITIIGPAGSVQLEEGVIIAQRHIHMTPMDAELYGVKDGQSVQIKSTGERGLIFENVIVRISPDYALEFHIDSDEANGAGIQHGEMGYLISAQLSFDGVEDVLENTLGKEVKAPIVKEPINLVTEGIVRDAWKEKTVLAIKKGAICTPLARDTIKELDVEVIWK